MQQEQQSQLQQAFHKERERSVQLHLFLLSHASRCKESHKCPSPNCARMKELLRHQKACKIRAKGGCGACKRIWSLLHLHARQCDDGSCRVPYCQQVRNRVRRIQEAAVAAARTQTIQEGTTATASSSMVKI